MTTVTQPRSGIPIGLLSIDGKTQEVELHPEFRRFFESMFNRVGGTTGAGSNDFALSQFEDAGTEETKAALAAAKDEFGQIPPSSMSAAQPDEIDNAEIASLRAEVDALRQIVQALQQGITQ